METKTLQKTSATESVISLVIALVIIYLGYAAYLHFTAQHLHYQLGAIETAPAFTPRWLLAGLQDGGFRSTLVAMTVRALHNVLAVLLGLIMGGLALAMYRWMTTEEKPEPLNAVGIYEATSDKIYVTVPSIANDKSVAEQYLRLDRLKLRLNRPPRNAIEQLEVAVQEILAAHQQWPADPTGHHSDVSLYKHSLQVAAKMAAKTDDSLARLVGLAHDFGKLVAYRPSKKQQSGWDIVTSHHDQMSANLVRLLPEYKSLNGEDQEVLRFTLKYYHAPQAIPAHATNRTRALVQKLRFADGLTTHENQQTPKDLAGNEEIIRMIAETVLEVIPNLNINKVRHDEHPDGFTGIAFDFVAIMEYPIRRGLSTHLKDERVVRQLSLRVDRAQGSEHPAAAVIHQAIQKTGLILESYAGETPANARFSVKSGKQTFSDVYLFDRAKLEKLYPDQIKHWGERPPYKLKVLTGRGATAHDEDQSPSSEAQEAPN